jgi:hypothetical protein
MRVDVSNLWGILLTAVEVLVIACVLLLIFMVLRHASAAARTCRQMIWSPSRHNHRCSVLRHTEHAAHRCKCGYLWENY